MQQKVLIVTTTESSNKFLENFSCWCAGALEAKGCHIALAIIPVEQFAEPLLRKFLKEQATKLKFIQNCLPTTEKLVLILPEYHSKLPVSLAPFIQLLASRKKYKTCQLVTVAMDSIAIGNKTNQVDALFSYPLQKLDTVFGSALCAKRIQIQNSPTGNMCPLFAEHYNDLISLIQLILD